MAAKRTTGSVLLRGLRPPTVAALKSGEAFTCFGWSLWFDRRHSTYQVASIGKMSAATEHKSLSAAWAAFREALEEQERVAAHAWSLIGVLSALVKDPGVRVHASPSLLTAAESTLRNATSRSP